MVIHDIARALLQVPNWSCTLYPVFGLLCSSILWKMAMVLGGKFCFLTALMLLAHFGGAARELPRKDGSDSEYAVKTIQTEHGDIYDCVDFYRQPALNHPLLKNHTFHPQMRPTSRPKRISNNGSKNSSMMNEIPIDMNAIRLKDGGCPSGTVPIRRKNKRDDYLPGIDGVVFAVGQTKGSPWRKYYGVGGKISVYNPKVLTGQYSSGEIILRGGSDTIIVGWTVNPIKYQDNKTRFFIYAVANGLRCFNSDCGFVIVRSDIPIDFVMSPVSTKGGPIYTNVFFVYQDEKNGNWWLKVGSPSVVLGFWPQNIFEGMKNSAPYAACGGEVYSPASITPAPEMGAGHYPDFAPDMLNDAFCKEFVVVDESHNVVDAADTEKYTDDPNYGVFDTHMRDRQHIVSFGGHIIE